MVKLMACTIAATPRGPARARTLCWRARTWPDLATNQPTGATGVTGSVVLPRLPPGPIDLTAPADLCSFDAYVNSESKMEVRWVAKPLGNAVNFRLLRSP